MSIRRGLQQGAANGNALFFATRKGGAAVQKRPDVEQIGHVIHFGRCQRLLRCV